MITYGRLFIGGSWTEPSNPQLLDIASPHDQSVVGRAAQAQPAGAPRATPSSLSGRHTHTMNAVTGALVDIAAADGTADAGTCCTARDAFSATAADWLPAPTSSTQFSRRRPRHEG
jgi:hypothetical protein